MKTATKPYAVMTGASSGTGYEFARVLADEGFDLFIAAEDQELERAKQELDPLTTVGSLRADLAVPENVELLHWRLRNSGRPIDVLTLNAGIGSGGFSSVAATMPGPGQAVYNASESFIQSFALALRNELGGPRSR